MSTLASGRSSLNFIAAVSQEGASLASRSIPWSYWDFEQVSHLLRQAHEVFVKKAA